MRRFNLYYYGDAETFFVAKQVLFSSFIEFISFIKEIAKKEGIPIKVKRINTHLVRVYYKRGLCFSLLDEKHKPRYKDRVFDRPILAIQMRNMLLDNI